MGGRRSAASRGGAKKGAVPLKPTRATDPALAWLLRLLELEGATVRALAEAEDLAAALPFVLSRTCDFAEWASGQYWSIDEGSGALRRVTSYGAASAAARSVLIEGEAAPAWLEADPVWLADAPSDGRARDSEWSSALVVPVLADGVPIGVLEFCSAGVTAPNREFLHVLRGVAVQLGHLHARGAAAERLRDSESRFASTMALAAIGISHVDDEGRFLYVNPQLCAMLGYSEGELLSRTVKEISHPDDRDTTHELSRQLREGTIASFKAEKRYRCKDGSVIWAGLTVALKRDRDGRKLYDVSIVEDISVRKEAERCVQYLASHDALTDLPNRATFTQLLAHACDTARRTGERFAVLFVDLDRFKIINDTLGHDAGDVTLREAATRLRACVRASDVVARLGGDEFVVLLPDVAVPAAAAKVASNILTALAAPVVIRGESCTVSASIGICMHPDGDQDDQAVLRNADMAMYLAKQSGKNGYRLYVNELKELAAERAALETTLRGALERGEIAVRYEARVDARSQAIVGFAARVQWHDAALAAVAPGKLAAVAEAAGLVVPVYERVLRTACVAAAAWQAGGLPGVPVAVSISPGQLNDPKLVGDVREALHSAGLAARFLELLVTEDALLANRDRSALALRALKALGVGLAIEAFGIGRASFADLQRFPLDAVVVDHTRIDGIAADADKQSYAEGVIALGKALGLNVVATGVATEADAAYLRASGCGVLQGPIVRQALAASDCEALLRERRGNE